MYRKSKEQTRPFHIRNCASKRTSGARKRSILGPKPAILRARDAKRDFRTPRRDHSDRPNLPCPTRARKPTEEDFLKERLPRGGRGLPRSSQRTEFGQVHTDFEPKDF